MRKMGGLKKHLPITFWTFLIATLAIAGIPPLAGFFSKDAILASAFETGHYALWAIGLITAGITACYMFRAVFMTFFGKFRGTHEQEHHLHESPPMMTIPLIVLCVGSVVAGLVGLPPVLAKVNQFSAFLAPVTEPIAHGPIAQGGDGHAAHHLSHSTEWMLILASVAVAVTGILIARRVYGPGRELAGGAAIAARFPGVHRLLEGKYFVDEIYDRFVVRPIAWLARLLEKVIDRLFIEGTINTGAFLTELVGDIGRFSTTGNVRNYALYFFLGLVAILWWMIL